MELHGMLEPAKVIVAIDFGTTYSGFSYAHARSAEEDPDNFLDFVQGFDRWPSQEKAGARPYWKTQTSLLYVQKSVDSAEYELKGWGWSAYHEYHRLRKPGSASTEVDGKKIHYITRFKLALAGADSYGETYILPEGFTAERCISDYLRELSIVIEAELQSKYGGHISKKDIQWCLTVPAIWEDVAKNKMRKCAERAGLVEGPANKYGEASPHRIIIVLEPEAASAYCLHYLQKNRTTVLPARSKILIVDAGGGTVDLVMHEKVNSRADCNQVKEICSGSSGALCGGTYVDAAFFKLLTQKIPCYQKFALENSKDEKRIRSRWDEFKIGFDGEEDYVFSVPGQLTRYWKAYNRANGLHHPNFDYEELEFTAEEIAAVFDTAVDVIVKLIDEQLAQVGNNDVDALLVVGGFSGSPFLMLRIREEFSGKVKEVLNPTQSGKAVVTGAVAYGCLGKEIVTARIARKTYGIGEWNGKSAQGEILPLKFDAFVHKGHEVGVESCVKRFYTASDWSPTTEDKINIEVYSSTDTYPDCVNDKNVVRECSYSFEYTAMEEQPCIEVSMFFGKTIIEVTAKPLNFQSGQVILPWISFAVEEPPRELYRRFQNS